MNWSKGLFRFWVVATVAWSGFWLAIALIDLMNGTSSGFGMVAGLAFVPPVLLGLVLLAIVWIAGGFRKP